ncbi:LrgB family protein [Salsuginibacillus kocurii]|uniref:LrgB family protein n=1 Tax=Salsuginibacillus kocurii TaxID=427078 RepID=UPI000373EF2D|nr:LrgB family protein [Salsuginibacillus kocurii]
MSIWIAVLMITGTIGLYVTGRFIYQRIPHPLTLPLVTSTFLLLSLLLLFDIPYETYMLGGQWIEILLGPAVVALAYPLFNQWHLLKQYFYPLSMGMVTGALVGIFSGYFLARLAGVDETVLFSIVPKSVTTPVAMDVAATLGGNESLAAIFVMIAGLGGVMIAQYTFRLFNIQSFIGRGIGTGTASHAIGTAKALENNEIEGAVSSIAMTVSAVIVAFFAPLIIALFH